MGAGAVVTSILQGEAEAQRGTCQRGRAGSGFRVDSPGPQKVRLGGDCPGIVTVPPG